MVVHVNVKHTRDDQDISQYKSKEKNLHLNRPANVLLVVWPSATKFPFRKEEKEKKIRLNKFNSSSHCCCCGSKLSTALLSNTANTDTNSNGKKECRGCHWRLVQQQKQLILAAKSWKLSDNSKTAVQYSIEKNAGVLSLFFKNTKALLFLFWLRVQHTAAAVLHWIEHFWYDILIESLSPLYKCHCCQ